MGLTPIKRPNGSAKTLTWSCHACGRIRADELIGVVSIEGYLSMDRGGRPLPPMRLRVTQRYCRDTPGCRAKAWAQAVESYETVRSLVPPSVPPPIIV